MTSNSATTEFVIYNSARWYEVRCLYEDRVWACMLVRVEVGELSSQSVAVL